MRVQCYENDKLLRVIDQYYIRLSTERYVCYWLEERSVFGLV